MGPQGERLVGERGAARLAARLAGVPRGCVEADACPLGGLLASIDGYSASESRLPWMGWADWGWKAAVAAASDLAASGATPAGLLVSVGAREPGVAVEVARGAGEAAAWMGAEVLGGDTNRCGCDAWVDVAALGALRYWSPRWAARPGHVLLRAGELGPGALALLALQGRVSVDDIPGGVLDYTRRPRPPLRLPEELWRAGCPPAAGVDNSDGWSETLWLLAEASGVRVELWSLGPSRVAAGAFESLGLPGEAAAASGEDYTLLLAFPGESVECALSACRRLGVDCEPVGRAVEGAPSVVYRGRPLGRGGWDSFAPP
ncbi:MAG: AIR synthase related protein [Desulfurococcales archaeon]|nr:AIR synthase related protein [Desulfurococcales archaeon]